MKRLYRAVCTWLEVDAECKASSEPVPEGNNFTHLENAGGYSGMPELHRSVRGTELEEDGGEYRRIGFTRGKG